MLKFKLDKNRQNTKLAKLFEIMCNYTKNRKLNHCSSNRQSELWSMEHMLSSHNKKQTFGYLS